MVRGCEPSVAKVTGLVRFLTAICPVLCHSIGVILDFKHTYPVAARHSWKIMRWKL